MPAPGMRAVIYFCVVYAADFRVAQCGIAYGALLIKFFLKVAGVVERSGKDSRGYNPSYLMNEP